ncbi:MAG: tetratricopeptide repeat protein, partial [Phycisphaerales bacterium]
VFDDNSPHETPGKELFYEHVHLNFKGNYLLAKAVFNRVEEVLPQRVKVRRAESSQPLTQAECAQRLAYTQWDQYVIADEVLGRFIKKPPFTNQLYHEEQVRIMEQERDALKASITPETFKKVAVQYRWAIQNSLQDVFLKWKYGTFLVKELKDYRNAAQQFRLVRDSMPHSYVAYSALGSVLEAAGDFNTAITNYQNAIRIKPTCGDVYYSLGWIYQRQGRTKKAMGCYYKAMRFLPGHESTYNNLAHILYQQGKVDEAIEICRKGLVFLPNSPVLHSNLGLLLNKQGHRSEAIKELNISLELDPNSVATRGMLESVLKNSPN